VFGYTAMNTNTQQTFLRMSATCFGYLNVATIRLHRTTERKW